MTKIFVNKNVFLFTESLTKNSVTFKRWDGVRDENFNIMGVRWNIRLLGRRGLEKTIYRGYLPKRGTGGRGLGQFPDLRWSWQKRRGGGFFEGGWYPNAHTLSVL